MVPTARDVKPSVIARCLIGAVAALALASCGPEPASAPATQVPAQAVPVAPEPAQPALDISGEWRVAEVVASPPEPGTPVIRISITGDTIRAQSQCKHYWWTYTATGSAFDATHADYPEPMCERTDSYWEQFFVEAIERANIAAPQPDGSLLLTGPGGQVLLRRS